MAFLGKNLQMETIPEPPKGPWAGRNCWRWRWGRSLAPAW